MRRSWSRTDRTANAGTGLPLLVAVPGRPPEPRNGAFGGEGLPAGSGAIARVDFDRMDARDLGALVRLAAVSKRHAGVACVVWSVVEFGARVDPVLATLVRPDATVVSARWHDAEVRAALLRDKEPAAEVVEWLRRYRPVDEAGEEIVRVSASAPLDTPFDAVAARLHAHRSTIFRTLRRRGLPSQGELIRLGACLRAIRRLQLEPGRTIEEAALLEEFSSASAFRSQFKRRFRVQPSVARRWFGLKPLLARYWRADREWSEGVGPVVGEGTGAADGRPSGIRR